MTTKYKTIEAMREDAGPLKCVVCEAPLTKTHPGRPPTTLCRDEECRREFRRVVAADRYAAERMQPVAKGASETAQEVPFP